MTDTQPFAPFQMPPAQEAPKEVKRRGPRKPRGEPEARTPTEAFIGTDTTSEEAPKRRGRPKGSGAAVGKPAGNGLKLDVKVMLQAMSGIGQEDAAVLGKLIGLLEPCSKASRRQLVESLGRMFA